MNYFLTGACYFEVGDYINAEIRIRQALELKPDSQVLTLWQIRVLIATKRLDDAEKQLLTVETIHPLRPDIMTTMRNCRAQIAALRGEREKALSFIKEEKALYRYEITNIYSLLGMKDEAVSQIKKGNEGGFQLIKDYLYSYPYLINNPCFDGLRDYPKFQKIVRNEEAKYRAKMKKYGDL